MKKGKKAQAAIEYIAVAALVAMLVLPGAYLFYTYSHRTTEEVDQAQIDKLGRDIVAKAEEVYAQGALSRAELEARMPKGVVNLSIKGDWETHAQQLIIYAVSQGGMSDYPFSSRVNINGTFNRTLLETTVNPGIKKINIEAYETIPDENGKSTPFAFINFGGRCPGSSTYDITGDGNQDANDVKIFLQCYCDRPGWPNQRPSKFWKSGWFNTPALLGCMNADYDSDCYIGNNDCATFCQHVGLCTCPPPPCA